MRKTIALAALALSVTTLSACGTQTDATATSPTGEWQTLAQDFNGFATALSTAAIGDDVPATAAELDTKVGYDFAEGVTLADWQFSETDENAQLCLTGPEDTYLTFSLSDSGWTRTLGTGDCDYTDGDIVLDNTALADAADNAAVRSDAKALATGIETLIVDTLEAPATLDQKTLDQVGVRLSDGVEVRDYATTDDAYNYRFCVVKGDTYATYDSTKGGLTSTGTDGTCDFDGTVAESAESTGEQVVKGEDLAAQVPALKQNPFEVREKVAEQAQETADCIADPASCE